MKQTIFIFSVLVFLVLQKVNAQSTIDRAKAYYFEAAASFEKGDYQKALDYCKEVENILGNSNARVEVLRVKSYFELGHIEQAKQALNRFSSYNAEESLSKEIGPYLVKIDEKVEYDRTHTTCSRCHGHGKYEEQVACGSCRGSGGVTCDADCSWCKGKGRLYGRNPSHGSSPCGMCNGSGKWGTKTCPCDACNGARYTGTRDKTCVICNGKGDVRTAN